MLSRTQLQFSVNMIQKMNEDSPVLPQCNTSVDKRSGLIFPALEYLPSSLGMTFTLVSLYALAPASKEMRDGIQNWPCSYCQLEEILNMATSCVLVLVIYILKSKKEKQQTKYKTTLEVQVIKGFGSDLQ